MHFRNRRKNKTSFNFKIGGSKIELVDQNQYLGIIFDEYLTLEKCGKALSEFGGRALGFVISKFKQFKNVGYNTFTKLYDTGVNSIISYGASIWGYGNEKLGQAVQNRAMRYFLGVHKTAPLHSIQADMGWLSVKYQYYLCMIRLWNRLIKMPDGRITKKVAVHSLINVTDSNWFGKLCHILDQMNKTNYIIEEREIDLKDIKFHLSDIMHIEWSNTVGYKPKLRNYTKFKQDIHTEKYVISNISRSQRSFLAQVRMGILPLNVETGRYLRKPLNERLCLLCKEREIEDEYHFLCSCQRYKTERNQICSGIPNFKNLTPDDQFVSLMRLNPKVLAKFIESIWNKRKFLLEDDINC